MFYLKRQIIALLICAHIYVCRLGRGLMSGRSVTVFVSVCVVIACCPTTQNLQIIGIYLCDIPFYTILVVVRTGANFSFDVKLRPFSNELFYDFR